MHARGCAAWLSEVRMESYVCICTCVCAFLPLPCLGSAAHAHPRVCARVVAQGHRRTGKWERPSLAGALSGRRGAARHATGRISFEFVRPAVAGFINTHYNQTLSIFGEPSDTIWAVGSIASATPMCVDSGAAPGWRWRTLLVSQ